MPERQMVLDIIALGVIIGTITLAIVNIVVYSNIQGTTSQISTYILLCFLWFFSTIGPYL